MSLNSSNPLGLKKRLGAYMWVTWLAPYLCGESQCKFRLWILANFKVPSSNEAPSDWMTQHGSLTSEVAHVFREDGFEVKEENANTLHLKTTLGVTLAGKPDVVALNGKAVVIDAKTGKPKAKDRAQVNLYQALIPAQKLHGIQEVPWGQLIYKSGEVKMIPPNEIDDAFKQSVRDLLAVAAQPMAPDPQPNANECRFCKLRDICPYTQTELPEADGAVDWL